MELKVSKGFPGPLKEVLDKVVSYVIVYKGIYGYIIRASGWYVYGRKVSM